MSESYEKIKLDSARQGYSNEAIEIECTTIRILKNDATDLEIAVNKANVWYPVPNIIFAQGQATLKKKVGIWKLWFKHSAVAGGELWFVTTSDPVDETSFDIESTPSTGGGEGILKGAIFDTSKNAGADWFSSDIQPTNTPCMHRMFIVMTSTTKVKVILKEGAKTKTGYLNDGAQLDGGELYIFDIMLNMGQSYNIQHDTTNQNVTVTIVEVTLGG